jgi:2-hydroxy-3-oxopropionate reductase
MRIGFIGLGIMGRPMSRNLINAGHEVIGYNRSCQAMDELVRSGGKAALSVADLAHQSQFIITMLPNSPDVYEVALGIDGLADNASPGSLLVDMSSIAPLAARKIHDGLAERKIRMIDAPVSGGEPKAIEGTLSVMVGGSQSDFDEALPILRSMASSVIRVGNIGAGNIAKLANQIVVAVNIASLGEALTLATKAGADPGLVFQAIRGGLAGSTVMDAKAPMMLAGDIKPGFKIDLHLKDLANVLDTGQSVGVPLPLSSMVADFMMTLQQDGLGKADHSALVRYYENMAGTKVGKDDPSNGHD